MEEVILVDKEDKQIGVMEKIQAHKLGELHRAFSLFIFNSKGEVLLQKRSKKKYHSGGLWSNTCCSHPRPGELTIDAANRRLSEEMGMSSKLIPAFSFIYKSELDNHLTEHEFDHVFFGFSDKHPAINKEEVEDYRFENLDTLKTNIEQHPEEYTSWLKICLDETLSHLNKTSFIPERTTFIEKK